MMMVSARGGCRPRGLAVKETTLARCRAARRAQVNEAEMVWDDGAAAHLAAGSEQQLRVEREREIACYLLMVMAALLLRWVPSHR